MQQFVPGQRWISETEPELGLGTLLKAEQGRVQIFFPSAGEMRLYAAAQAPLRRVRFRIGDTITTHQQVAWQVEAVEEADGLLTYIGAGETLPEALLSDSLSFQQADERLLNQQFDSRAAFDLRCQTLVMQHQRRQSPVLGFIGGRIDLIPHQLYIAHTVSAQQVPRVLLSDDVGLGKTIEACLIIHRLLLAGRAKRVLVVVPESLVHQWFVELLRRFNLWFHIFDEERCVALEGSTPQGNPFFDDQLVLCSRSFLATSPQRARQAMTAGWDVVVVDEAHHLEWSPSHVSPDYRLVEALSRVADGLLLLTATPEQLGRESHFARLRLLDPQRYSDFEAFQREDRDTRATADVVEKLATGTPLVADDRAHLRHLFAATPSRITERLEQIQTHADARQTLLDDVLDLHGPGRVLFRNTRAAMDGFPQRRPQLVALDVPDTDYAWKVRLAAEFRADIDASLPSPPFAFRHDPRVTWLIDHLHAVAPEKVLLICRTKAKTQALHAALRERVNLKAAVFHEDLSLVQRDRNAAWFAEPDGARLLICSEIGSEGRNFQFAHHLVLFDLPLNPELLEQRIGRLDRIGQHADIQIHVPYVVGTAQELLSRWYHEGLGAFATSLAGGNTLLQTFGEQVQALAATYPDAAPEAAEVDALIEATRKARQTLAQRLEAGRDRLLERHSFRPPVAQRLIDAIRAHDRDPQLETYMLAVFDAYGVQYDAFAPHSYRISPRAITTDAFPAIPEDGMGITFDRVRALSREDLGFVTWDHPMVIGAMDVILGSEYGNSSFALLPDRYGPSVLLEVLFVVEPIAASYLHADRFLAPTPIRVVVDEALENVTDAYPTSLLARKLRQGYASLLDEAEDVSLQIPVMLRTATAEAQVEAEHIIQRSLQTMTRQLDHEIERLDVLQAMNGHVWPDERKRVSTQKEALHQALQGAHVRLDAVRLIWKGMPE